MTDIFFNGVDKEKTEKILNFIQKNSEGEFRIRETYPYIQVKKKKKIIKKNF
jgi:hypothetical protein